LIEVKSFTDRKGNRVVVGDTVGYFGQKNDMRASGKVKRITKAGYHIAIHIEGLRSPWYKPWVEKVSPNGSETTEIHKPNKRV
jgi:hypothetical protein